MNENVAALGVSPPPLALGEARLSLTPAAQLALVDELDAALARGEFEMLYQPRVDCRSEAIVGLEALVRWRHPRFGWLQPEQFIPLFERCEAIQRLGDWIVATVCAVFPALDRHAGRDLKVAVNVSARQLEDPDFAVKLLRTGERVGSTRRLELELTETARIDDKELAARQLRRLAARGVTIALDDFGTGFSTLQDLRLFPVAVLKIDATFVQNVALDRDDARLVESLIGLAHSLGVLAVAEGIESPLQAATLRALGCDQAQGYHFFRPARLGRIQQWLEQEHPGPCRM